MDANRLKVIAYNAIVMWQEENFYEWNNEEEWREHVMDELGVTEDEYIEIMGNYEEDEED